LKEILFKGDVIFDIFGLICQKVFLLILDDSIKEQIALHNSKPTDSTFTDSGCGFIDSSDYSSIDWSDSE
jgi:hypothetical protein